MLKVAGYYLLLTNAGTCLQFSTTHQFLKCVQLFFMSLMFGWTSRLCWVYILTQQFLIVINKDGRRISFARRIFWSVYVNTLQQLGRKNSGGQVTHVTPCCALCNGQYSTCWPWHTGQQGSTWITYLQKIFYSTTSFPRITLYILAPAIWQYTQMSASSSLWTYSFNLYGTRRIWPNLNLFCFHVIGLQYCH